MRALLRVSLLTALATVALTSAAGAASAEEEDLIPPPCKVHDLPTVYANPPFVYAVDLHTEAECFGNPVSVG